MSPTSYLVRVAFGLLLSSTLSLSLSGCAASRLTVKIDASHTQSVITLTADHANVYLLPGADGKLLLIDSGFPQNAQKLEAQIQAAGFAPANVSVMILTHGHYDHAGAARYFQEHYGTKVIAGRGDEAMLASGHNEPICPTGFLARRRYAQDSKGTFPPLKADMWLDAPIPLSAVAGIDGRIIPMPGHTKGSLIVVVGDGVFVGDLFRGSVLFHGAETHFYMCDLPANHRDIRNLLDQIAPDATEFFPGHFGPLTRASVNSAFP